MAINEQLSLWVLPFVAFMPDGNFTVNIVYGWLRIGTGEEEAVSMLTDKVRQIAITPEFFAKARVVPGTIPYNFKDARQYYDLRISHSG